MHICVYKYIIMTYCQTYKIIMKTKNQFGNATIIALLTLLLSAIPFIGNAGVKPTWQEKNAQEANFLKNRRALVGRGCMVNRVGGDLVNVIPVATNLENLCDEDLDNVATVACAVEVGAALNPLISVKDMRNYYAAGTEAGFVVTGDASGLLKIDAAEFFSIMFYKDGQLVDTQPVKEGQAAHGVGISLIHISTNEACKEFVATSQKDFDEIRLAQAKVLSIEAVKVIGLKYAFVGKKKEYTITQTSMKQYAQDMGKGEIITESQSSKLTDGVSAFWNEGGNLDNDDLNDHTVISSVLSIEKTFTAEVRSISKDGSETFKKGTTVGFKYGHAGALDLGLIKTAVIKLYDKNGNDIQRETISADVLGLNIISGNSGSVSIKSTVDFSHAEFYFTMLAEADLGATYVNFAFISLEPDVAYHHCDISPSASLDMCDCDNQYVLKHNDAVNVTWSIKNQPQGSNIVLDAKTGKISELMVHGEYVFTATADDGCAEDVVIKYGITKDPVSSEESGETIFVNEDGKPEEYVIAEGKDHGIDILASIKNVTSVLTKELRDFAYYTGGISLLSDKYIIGVKRKDGHPFPIYQNTKKIGFVLATKTDVLNTKLLKFFNIRLYNKGEVVLSKLVTDNAVLSAGAIAGDKTQKISYTIDVPAGTEFDEVSLHSTGVLDADLKQLSIYYAYAADKSEKQAYDDEIISLNTTGATIDAARTVYAGVANVGNSPCDLTNLIDDDLNTAFMFPSGVTVGDGTQVAVKIGKTISPKQQLVVVTDNNGALLGAGLADVLKVELLRNGEVVATNDKNSQFSVLDANVLGFIDNKGYICLGSRVDFDEVKLTQVKVISAADVLKIYGLTLRNDYNADGIADYLDPEPCVQELVLDEAKDLQKAHNYDKVKMVFRRNLNGNAWNSIVLPVDMTRAQFNEAFGFDARLSEIDKINKEQKDGKDVNVIMFKEVTAETDGVFLKKNTPYIIYVSEAEVAKHPAIQYESVEDGILSGSIYVVNEGISYDMTNDMNTQINVTSIDSPELTFNGSFQTAQEIPAGSYVFNKGNLYHTSKSHTQKAYRCWINYNPATTTDMLYGFNISNNGTTSGITEIISDDANNRNMRIYSIDGKIVNNNNNLQPGIYIINGKKVVK